MAHPLSLDPCATACLGCFHAPELRDGRNKKLRWRAFNQWKPSASPPRNFSRLQCRLLFARLRGAQLMLRPPGAGSLIELCPDRLSRRGFRRRNDCTSRMLTVIERPQHKGEIRCLRELYCGGWACRSLSSYCWSSSSSDYAGRFITGSSAIKASTPGCSRSPVMTLSIS